ILTGDVDVNLVRMFHRLSEKRQLLAVLAEGECLGSSLLAEAGERTRTRIHFEESGSRAFDATGSQGLAVRIPLHRFERRGIGLAQNGFLHSFEVVKNGDSCDVSRTRLAEQDSTT